MQLKPQYFFSHLRMSRCLLFISCSLSLSFSYHHSVIKRIFLHFRITSVGAVFRAKVPSVGIFVSQKIRSVFIFTPLQFFHRIKNAFTWVNNQARRKFVYSFRNIRFSKLWTFIYYFLTISHFLLIFSLVILVSGMLVLNIGTFAAADEPSQDDESTSSCPKSAWLKQVSLDRVSNGTARFSNRLIQV